MGSTIRKQVGCDASLRVSQGNQGIHQSIARSAAMIKGEQITVIPAPVIENSRVNHDEIKLAKTRSGDQLMVVIDPQAFSAAYVELAGELNRVGNATMKASLLRMVDAVAVVGADRFSKKPN